MRLRRVVSVAGNDTADLKTLVSLVVPSFCHLASRVQLDKLSTSWGSCSEVAR